MNQKQTEDLRKAGKIAVETVKYAKSIIKPGIKLLEIAEKIENKILELGGKLAFPISLSIDEIAAHYTPAYNDETKASGLLKIDLGVHINGQIVDTAFSMDLENSEENKRLIQAAEQALEQALKIVKPEIELKQIGKIIQKTIMQYNFSPVRNLCGHELGNYEVHAGLTIPNCDNNSELKLKKGIYAIEPFSTTGAGLVYEGKPSGIYKLQQAKAIRDSLARQILIYIEENYKTLPFSAREIINKFGTRAIFSLKLMENENILKQYPQLIEKNHKPVAQAEHTILVTDKVEILTA